MDVEKHTKISEALGKINVKALKKKLAKKEEDNDLKGILELVAVCKQLISKPKRRVNWIKTARALYDKIKSHDPLHINLVDSKRAKDGTWCMWMTWNYMTSYGTKSGYSLVSGAGNAITRKDAAYSFIEDFCKVGPQCLVIYDSPYTSETQRLANAAIVEVYKELGKPTTPEYLAAKLTLDG
jgi:hypothetical protein